MKNVTHFVYVAWFNYFFLYPFYFVVLCCFKMYNKKKHQKKLDKCSEQLIHECKYTIGQYKNESMFSIIIIGVNHLLHLTDIMVFYKLNICGNPMSASFSISIFFNSNFFTFCHIFSNSCNIQTFSFLCLLWWSVISDVFTMICWRFRWWLAFYSNKLFLN